MKKNKKAAIELSIGTVVIIVLAMSMLVLGIALIRNIFKGATGVVDLSNDKVLEEITSLFSDEGSDIVVKLGADQTAKIKQDSGPFSVGIGARKTDRSAITAADDIKYKITLDEDTPGNCYQVYGDTETEKLFLTPLGTPDRRFDKFEGSQAFAVIQLNVPDAVPLCTQKVYIEVKETGESSYYAGNYFIVEIQEKGFF